MKNISQHILEKLQISRNKPIKLSKVSSVMDEEEFGTYGRRYYFWKLFIDGEIEGFCIGYPQSQMHKGTDPFLYLVTARYEIYNDLSLRDSITNEIGKPPRTLFVPPHEFVKYAAHSLPEDAAKYLRKLLFFLGDEDTFFTKEYDRDWSSWEFYSEDNG